MLSSSFLDLFVHNSNGHAARRNYSGKAPRWHYELVSPSRFPFSFFLRAPRMNFLTAVYAPAQH